MKGKIRKDMLTKIKEIFFPVVKRKTILRLKSDEGIRVYDAINCYQDDKEEWKHIDSKLPCWIIVFGQYDGVFKIYMSPAGIIDFTELFRISIYDGGISDGVYFTIPGVGFKRIEAGERDSAGPGFRTLKVSN